MNGMHRRFIFLGGIHAISYILCAICGRVATVLAYDGTIAKSRATIQSDEPLLIYIFMSSSWEIVEQFFRCYRQSLGELNDVLERDVPFPALNSADIIPVESCPFCKFLLRQAPFHAKRSHRASEPRFHRLRGHLSSFRADHYESTHDECYLFSCVKAWDRIAETRAFAAAPSGGRSATEIGSATYTGQGILSMQRGLASSAKSQQAG